MVYTYLNGKYPTEQDLEEHYLQIKKGIYDRIECLKDNSFNVIKDNKKYYPTPTERQLAIAELQDTLETLDEEFNTLLKENGSRKRV